MSLARANWINNEYSRLYSSLGEGLSSSSSGSSNSFRRNYSRSPRFDDYATLNNNNYGYGYYPTGRCNKGRYRSASCERTSGTSREVRKTKNKKKKEEQKRFFFKEFEVLIFLLKNLNF